MALRVDNGSSWVQELRIDVVHHEYPPSIPARNNLLGLGHRGIVVNSGKTELRLSN